MSVRWWSLWSQCIAAWLCPSCWWSRTSLLLPFTGAWHKRRGTCWLSFPLQWHAFVHSRFLISLHHGTRARLLINRQKLPPVLCRCISHSCKLAGCSFNSAGYPVTSNLKTSSGGFWLQPTCLAVAWTSSESTLSSTTTCRRIRTRIFTESVQLRHGLSYQTLSVSSTWALTFFSVTQVARAGRFGTKGLAITFVSDETDAKTLNEVQDRFEVNVAELPEEIDISSYSEFLYSCPSIGQFVCASVHKYPFLSLCLYTE